MIWNGLKLSHETFSKQDNGRISTPLLEFPILMTPETHMVQPRFDMETKDKAPTSTPT